MALVPWVSLRGGGSIARPADEQVATRRNVGLPDRRVFQTHSLRLVLEESCPTSSSSRITA